MQGAVRRCTRIERWKRNGRHTGRRPFCNLRRGRVSGRFDRMSGIVQQNCNGATGQSCLGRVGTAGQDRLERVRPGRCLRAARRLDIPAAWPACCRSRDRERPGCRPARDWRIQMFDLGGLCADRSIEGQRAVENAAGDLAAVGHLAQCRGFHAWTVSWGSLFRWQRAVQP